LVKRPGKLPGQEKKRPDAEMFGKTHKDGRLYAIDLVDDPRDVPVAERNEPFAKWCDLLDVWEQRLAAATGEQMEVRRLDQTMTDAFNFLHGEGIDIDLFGPVTETVAGKPALEFLRKPKDDVSIILGTQPVAGGTVSASHTINGHSVNFRLRQKNVRMLFTGDMNQESMQRMRDVLPDLSLRSEILKTPHHGSADFDYAFLQEVSPVVSLVSSGDEGVRHEHIHPRATLMAALGKASRQMPAVVFATELAAFFAYRGPSTDKQPTAGQKADFEGFERLNYGIIHVRTDGERVLAFTHSGKRGMNEAYRFTVSATGEIAFAPKAVSRAAPKKE
ncbi:MAG: competence protein, partial [Sphingomonas sp.]|nr:competence protein [Sphingomonas sp.]